MACRSTTQTSRLSPQNVALARDGTPEPNGRFQIEMKHLPDDLLRIILAFASPTVGARQLAARARTLDEEVEFRPSNEPENYPCRHPRTGEIILQTGPRWDVKIADATDEIARRDAVLRPLSLALPELRIRMHGDESTGMTPKGAPCGGWWHARCGHDWTDPVFF